MFHHEKYINCVELWRENVIANERWILSMLQQNLWVPQSTCEIYIHVYVFVL